MALQQAPRVHFMVDESLSVFFYVREPSRQIFRNGQRWLGTGKTAWLKSGSDHLPLITAWNTKIFRQLHILVKSVHAASIGDVTDDSSFRPSAKTSQNIPNQLGGRTCSEDMMRRLKIRTALVGIFSSRRCRRCSLLVFRDEPSTQLNANTVEIADSWMSVSGRQTDRCPGCDGTLSPGIYGRPTKRSKMAVATDNVISAKSVLRHSSTNR
jgi:hypothetical protein